jgi:hypothetical protein
VSKRGIAALCYAQSANRYGTTDTATIDFRQNKQCVIDRQRIDRFKNHSQRNVSTSQIFLRVAHPNSIASSAFRYIFSPLFSCQIRHTGLLWIARAYS